jgi:topoisomerase-4 subunit B
MKTSMTKAYNEYARKVGLLKERDKNLEGSDFREGLAAVLSIRVPENLLQFEGQTKGKLGTPIARTAVDNVIGEQMGFFCKKTAR